MIEEPSSQGCHRLCARAQELRQRSDEHPWVPPTPSDSGGSAPLKAELGAAGTEEVQGERRGQEVKTLSKSTEKTKQRVSYSVCTENV